MRVSGPSRPLCRPSSHDLYRSTSHSPLPLRVAALAIVVAAAAIGNRSVAEATTPPTGAVRMLAVSVVGFPDTIVCRGETITLSATATGDDPPYTYTWDQGLGAGQSHTITVTGDRTYRVTVTDALGATATDDVVVRIDDQAPVFDALPPDVIYECGDGEPPPPTLTVTDDADPAPTLTLSVEECGDAPSPAYYDEGGRTRYVAEVHEDPNFTYPGPVANLLLTAMCSYDPVRERRWRARNPNPFPVYATYDVFARPEAGAFVIPANTDLYFFTRIRADPVILYWVDHDGNTRNSRKSGNNNICPEGEYTACAPCPTLRTWTARDACGNERTFLQRVYALDSTAPVFDVTLADTLRVNPTDVPPPPAVNAVDGCTPTVAVDFAEARTDGTCPQSYTLRRRWSAVDDCGNADSIVQIVVVADTTAPTISGLGPDRTLACDAVPPGTAVTVSDDADPAPTWSMRTDTILGDCPGDFAVVDSVAAADACGNTAAAGRRTSVVDTVPPAFTYVPGDTTIAFDAPVPTESATADDACSQPASVVEEAATREPDAAGGEVVTRTWFAVDACGNGAFAQQRVTIAPEPRDTTIVEEPADTVVVEPTDSLIVEQPDDDLPEIIVYTGFTPNGDGTGETFTIENIEAYPDNQLLVFSRWGLVVYEAERYLNTWDGRYYGGDLPDGTYFYLLKLGPDIEPEAGYLQLWR